jgi:multiple sugar transport system ATP-binding protein
VASITFDHITKRYVDGFEAVKDMSLTVADGEFMILVGPSGSGKSTALRMVAGLEDITEGELRIGDEVVNDRAPKDRDIAMVFQDYALYPHMTVRQNMGFALKLARARPRRRSTGGHGRPSPLRTPGTELGGSKHA